MAGVEDRELLVRISWLYYRQGLTQEQISKKIGLSRIKIQRLLVRARDEGIVEIRVNSPFEVCLELRQRLEDHYGLKEVAVVPSAWTDEGLEEALGQVGAEMLTRLTANVTSVGVGWGSTISAVVEQLREQNGLGAVTIGLLGNRSKMSTVNPGEIALALSRKLGGECFNVMAPCFVDSRETRDILLSQPSIQQTFDLAEQADLALVGIGTTLNNATLVQSGFLTSAEMAKLRAMGAVGDVLGHFVDSEGNIVESEFEERVMSLGLDKLKAIPRVMCVAGGPDKVRAIQAALRAKLFDTLVTDEQVAKALVAGTRADSL